MHAPTDTQTRPVGPPAPGWAALGTWFDAPLPQGTLQLYLGEPGGPAGHAAAAALALQRATALLEVLDDWLGEPSPDWRWQPDPAARPGPAMLRLPWRDSCHQLLAPWSVLRRLPPPTAGLVDVLQWPAVDAVLAVARPGLRPEEVRLLEPGGAVLLAESLQPGWTGWLRSAHEDCSAGAAVRLDDPRRPRVQPGGPAGAASPGPGAAPPGPADGQPGRAFEVRLGLQRAVPADGVAGWRADALAGAVSADLAATLWQLPAGRDPAHCLAHGRLLPWGDGWAMLIDGLGEEPAQTHGWAAA
jgi:hypothetical protein